MLIRTSNPHLLIKVKDLEIVQKKMVEFDIEKISMYTKDDSVSIHLYGEKSNIDKLINWLENEFDGNAELAE